MTEIKNEEEIKYLNNIIEKLDHRLAEVKASLSDGQQEIQNMQEYYWENYAEMDEYGYEEFDNQQALLQQVNANQEKLVMKQRLERMIQAPYFGRVDFLYDGDDEPETFYIGIANFAERSGMRPLIYDWRAPVSGLFYDYDQGPASYEAPSGTLTGEITSKWQYKIKNGKIIYAFESDTKIDDDILKEELGTNSDVKLKNIVSTIQKEQNAIIRNTKDRILVIQGAAGSGKTSVALHRIAYLLYHDRENLTSSDILILSPNSVFSDYIAHILPELGEENVQEMSFDLFAYHELKKIAGDCEDRYDQLERLMHFPDSEAEKRYREKQSSAFVGMMEGFLAVLEDQLMDFHKISFGGLTKTEEELIHLFYFRFQNIPLLARMDAVMEYCIDEYETLKGKNISQEGREYIESLFERQYVTKDIYTIYNWMMEMYGYPELPELETEKRKVEYEDVFPMLYLKYRLCGKGAHRRVKHLIIDEMQDYSYLQYVILEHLFSCKMTILGDRAQTMDGEIQDVLRFLPKIFGKNIRRIEMKKSYRNTVEIAEYASDMIGIHDLELLERHGKPVTEQIFDTESELLDAVEQNLNAGQGGYETAAVLAMTEEEAFDIYRLLKNRGVVSHYIDRNSSAFKKGVTVTTYYLAKGLEFDQVFAVDGNCKNETLRQQAKYICATRALHELYVYRTEKTSANAQRQ